jgi:hypothetical protein
VDALDSANATARPSVRERGRVIGRLLKKSGRVGAPLASRGKI